MGYCHVGQLVHISSSGEVRRDAEMGERALAGFNRNIEKMFAYAGLMISVVKGGADDHAIGRGPFTFNVFVRGSGYLGALALAREKNISVATCGERVECRF